MMQADVVSMFRELLHCNQATTVRIDNIFVQVPRHQSIPIIEFRRCVQEVRVLHSTVP